ncbi:MAG: hypothetical protein MZV63_40410 [Marinilabiliales bacterium]|nr:hypothetical protein [Marinilabiliales bacterium]
MGPLAPYEIISENTNFLLAFFIGIAFGWVLESSGFSSSRKLAGIFYGYDTVVSEGLLHRSHHSDARTALHEPLRMGRS